MLSVRFCLFMLIISFVFCKEKKLFARQAEVFAAFLEMTDLVDVGCIAGNGIVTTDDGAGTGRANIEGLTDLVAFQIRDGTHDQVALAQFAGLHQQG